MKKLTRRQNDILNFIKKFVAKNGYSPTVREIGDGLNLSSPATIHSHIVNLEAKNYIKKAVNKNRTLEILVKNEYLEENENTREIPLLGKVTAGTPIEAIERPDEYFTVPSYLIPNGKEVFSLKVSGDSMVNIGILDNDVVIVQKQNTANNGDIVVAMNTDNEATLKTFYKEKDHFRLQPENDNYEPIILKEVTILGKAIGLYRKL